MARDRTAPAPYYVEGKTIVGTGPIILPELCVRCGTSAREGKRTEKTLYWAAPWLYVLILCNLLILAVVYLIVRKPVRVGYSQCAHCRGRQLSWIWAAWGTFLGAIAMFILAANREQAEFAVVGVIALVGLIVFAFLAQAPVQVKNFRDPNFVLGGFSQEFLIEVRDSDGDEEWETDCRSCGEPLEYGESVCPMCGTRQRRRS